MRRIVIEVRALAVNLGYRIRPYDDIRDARRWRWQARGKCGRYLPAVVQIALAEAVERHQRNEGKSDA